MSRHPIRWTYAYAFVAGLTMWTVMFFIIFNVSDNTKSTVIQQQSLDDFPWSDYSVSNQQPTFEDLLKVDASCQNFVDFWHALNYNFCMNMSSKSVAYPMYDYAYYAGQGFGRLIEHSTLKCVLGMSLNRPCIIDIDSRDEYYVWRSFVNIGSYDWSKKISKKTQTNIDDAISKLPKQENGEWDEQIFYDDIIPLFVDEKTKKTKNYANVINYWNANNAETKKKILVNPNWGASWFPMYDVNKPWKDAHSQCSSNELSTLVQNSLYSPTILSKKIHQKDRDLLLNETIYGSIHFRQVIMSEQYIFMPTYKELSDALRGCIKECLKDEEFAKMGVEKWWMIGDNVGWVKNISKDFDNVYHLYSDEFVANNKHSNSDDARSIYGRIHMEGSVRDWMILHESKVAFVTEGAFGQTGARGNGKIFRRQCKYYQVFF